MMVEGVFKDFNYKNHSFQSYWIMGCCGPFGIVDEYIPSKITFPILKVDKRIKPQQIDAWNCGPIWCLFIHDMMQQALVPYDFKLLKKQKLFCPWILVLERCGPILPYTAIIFRMKRRPLVKNQGKNSMTTKHHCTMYFEKN